MAESVEDYPGLGDIQAKLAGLEADMTSAQLEWTVKYKSMSAADQRQVLDQIDQGSRDPDWRRRLKARDIKQRRLIGGRP